MRILVFLICSVGWAQMFPQVAVSPPGTSRRIVTVTISGQGSMTKALSGLDLAGYSVTLCSGDARAITVGGGAVWQFAERSGLQPITPHVAAAAVIQKRSKSLWEFFLGVLSEALYEASMAKAGNVFHCNPIKDGCKIFGLALASGDHKIATFQAERSKVQPDPIAAFAADMLDPGGIYAIPAGSGVCPQPRLFLAAPGGPSSVHGEIAVVP